MRIIEYLLVAHKEYLLVAHYTQVTSKAHCVLMIDFMLKIR